jgi:hypothetical protein
MPLLTEYFHNARNSEELLKSFSPEALTQSLAVPSATPPDE